MAQHGPRPRVVLDSAEVGRAITRMAHEVIEAHHGAAGLMLLGIPTRGVPLSERLATAIERAGEGPVSVGRLDITMYRDDLPRHPTRQVGQISLPGSVDDATVILVDDVLFSGRSAAAALDALREFGRPRAVRLAVLVDRGHRQLPIRADHVGKNLPTAANERVGVRLTEIDGVTEVTITGPGEDPEQATRG